MPDSQSASYDNVVIHRQHVRDEGLMQVPVAGNGTEDAETIRLNDPVEMIHVSWTATKTGGPPMVPHPSAIDNEHVFLKGDRTAAMPIPAGNGDNIWSISGNYYYSLKKVRGLTSALPTAKLPWRSESAIENAIPSESFNKDILGNTT